MPNNLVGGGHYIYLSIKGKFSVGGHYFFPLLKG